MPAARSPADILCLALYILAGGRIMRGFMVQTIATRLGVSFETAEKMAIAADAACMVRHQVHTVTLEERETMSDDAKVLFEAHRALVEKHTYFLLASAVAMRSGRPERWGEPSGMRHLPLRRDALAERRGVWKVWLGER